MNKTLSFLILLLVFMLVSCGSRKEQKDEGEVAAKAAKAYYTELIQGKYESFLRREYRPGKLPDTYHAALLDNLKQFVSRRTEEHRGIDSVSIASATFSGKDSLANTFLIMHFSDGTSEQILVPMVKKKGTWYMR